MGDRPHDDPPPEAPASRPARSRPAASARTRPRPPSARARPARGARPRPPSAGRRPGSAAGRRRRGAPAADQPESPAGSPARPPGRGRQPSPDTMVVILSVLSVLVVGLVVYAFVLRPSASVTSSPGGQATSTTVDPSAPGTSLPESDFAVFTSQKMGFTMKYPRTWPTGETDSGEMVVDAGGADAISARLEFRTEVPTSTDNLDNVKAFTDALIAPGAVVLKVQKIAVNGMPGYYYLYTFTDRETGAEGAHAHYFLFRGRNMYTLVFQALPSDGFGRLSRIFDQMAASFQTEPDNGTFVPAVTTTVPPAG